MSKISRHIVNGPPVKPSGEVKPWFTVRNEATAERAEILIYAQIGKGWYSDDGVDAKDFDAALKAIPTTREILVRINSQGGNVWIGLAIYNMLKARRDKVTCRVDGIAASIASVIFMAGGKREMPANAMLMAHRASTYCGGNAADMKKMADVLEQHDNVIAGIYAENTGKPVSEMLDIMEQETWMTGKEAQEKGFCDDVTDEVAIAACVKDFDLSGFRRVPEVLNKSNPQKPSTAPGSEANPRNIMDRNQIIALLKEHGVTVENTISDADLLAKMKEVLKAKAQPAPAPAAAPSATPAPANTVDLAAVVAQLAAIQAQNAAMNEARIKNEITALANEGRIPLNSVDAWVKLAVANETGVMAQLKSMPVHQPGAEPINNVIDIVAEDPKSIEKGILRCWGGKQILDAASARERGVIRAEIIAKNIDRIMPVLNTNTVSTDLKRTVILQQSIRAFARRILMLTAFSTRLNGVKLEGTDKVAVPYFALDTTASTDFVAANGYDTFGNTNSDAKTVTIDKRKYQGLKWTSSELRRQPFLDVAKGAMLKAEQLGKDCVDDVLSLITVANFGAAVKTEPASAFDSDDIADLKGVADDLDWPEIGRSLILSTAYDVNVLKDNSVKSALNFGDNSPIRDGVVRNILGFDYFRNSYIPANAENLTGFIVWMSAILYGQAPVDPTEEVRNLLSRYEVVVEPTCGCMFEYRMWGDPDLDTTKEIIEVNYGKSVGEPTALRRITSQ